MTYQTFTTYMNTYRRLADLTNGLFLNAAEASEFAAWTGLSAECTRRAALGERFAHEGDLVGMVNLIAHVARQA